VICAGVEVSRKEGKKELSVICVEVMVWGTRGNEGAERSGVHGEEQWTKDTALGTPQEDVCQEDRSVTHVTRKQRDDRYDLNQLRTEPWIPNQDERPVNRGDQDVVVNSVESSR